MKINSFRLPAVAVALVLALTAGCESGVLDPQPLSGETAEAINVLPQDALFVGMVDFRSMAVNEFTSPFANGPFALDKLGDEPGARLRDFLAATGFDPEKDLDRAFVASAGRSHGEDAIVIAYADFDSEKLVSFLREQSPVSLSETSYRDLRVFTAAEDGHEFSVVVASGSMVLAGSKETVQQAIDRLVDGTASLASNSEMMSLVRRVSDNGSWFVAADVASDDDGGADHKVGPFDEAAIGAALANAAMGVRPSRTGLQATVYLEPRDGVQSKDLADLVKGAVSALKATSASKEDQNMQKLLDDVSVRTAGGVVQVDMTLDNAALARIKDDI